MKRLSLPVAAAATGAVLALGVITASAVPIGFDQDRSADLAKQINPNKPKSVILIIGDGTDDSMITAARNYELGAAGRFALDDLPFTGAMTTYGLKVGAGPDYPIAYVSDSAPTASGWSTGKKTVDGRISQGPSAANTIPGTDYETVLERFQADGKLVGNVSTAEVTDATPAAAAAHINARACQGPANMDTCPSAKKSAGGKGSIAEQLVDHEIDVLLGGGMNRFAQSTDAGPTVLAGAEGKGYKLVQDKAALASVTSLKDGPVLGLFTPGNMTPMNKPLTATAAGAGSADTRCEKADRGNQPSLSEMTAKAIDLLDNDKGFFLQTESAMVDKQEHASDICGAIGDLVEMDKTVAVALEYQKANPDTLVIVTGDHAHSTQIVGGAADDGVQRATVKTADGDPMTVAYSTNTVGSDHTGAQIRVAAIGPQGANVTGTIDQTDLFSTMLGRTPSTLPTSGPTVTVTATPTGAPSTPTTPTTAPTTAPTSAPTSPAPAKPSVWIAAPKRVDRDDETWVSVSVSGATTVSVQVRQRKNTMTKTLSSSGGSVKLPALGKGSVKVKVTATGAGGTAKASRSIRVR